MALNEQDLKNRGIFAPSAIVDSGTGAFDVRGYSAVHSGNTEFTVYFNTDSGNTVTMTGLLWIHPDVTSLVFAVDTELMVM